MIKTLNLALIGLQSGVDKSEAVGELVRLGDNVGDPFTAHKLLRDLPTRVKVKEEHLQEFKKVFDTQEYFHHQRIVGHLHEVVNREVWVTLRDSEASPDIFFAMIIGLISQPPWDKVLRGATIKLANGVTITLDKEPL